jgi:hypothetical protein
MGAAKTAGGERVGVGQIPAYFFLDFATDSALFNISSVQKSFS